MNDIERAKERLRTGGFTCVLCRGDKEYTSVRPGIAPMLEFSEAGTELKHFSAADRIIGKAAAMLFALADVDEVYGEVMSKAALPVLEKAGIRFSWGTLTDMIVNREGNGSCPMEEAVKDISDPILAPKLLREKLKSLSQKSSD